MAASRTHKIDHAGRYIDEQLLTGLKKLNHAILIPFDAYAKACDDSFGIMDQDMGRKIERINSKHNNADPSPSLDVHKSKLPSACT